MPYNGLFYNLSEALKTLENQAVLEAYLLPFRNANKKIGFVPTMGALHEGHLSLIRKAKSDNDVVVCSIFINPTQFNDLSDFERYPRVVGDDVKMLESADCDVLFLPSVKEIYPDDSYKMQIDFGELETLLEGKFRPGHFAGVGMVVKRLFDIVRPDKAYFGLKDYQQYLIIRKLVEIFKIPVEVIGMPTIRESDGLAMSSRNRLLTEEQRRIALSLSRVLNLIRDNFNSYSVDELIKMAEEELKKEKEITPEYIEIAEADSLRPAKEINKEKKYVALIAATAGKIRLIDNMYLN